MDRKTDLLLIKLLLLLLCLLMIITGFVALSFALNEDIIETLVKNEESKVRQFFFHFLFIHN